VTDDVRHVGSTSSCPVLLASEMSGLHRKVHLRRKPAGGCTRGAAAPLVGEARQRCVTAFLAGGQRASGGGGTLPPPPSPRGGNREGGASIPRCRSRFALRRYPSVTHRLCCTARLRLRRRQLPGRPPRYLVWPKPNHHSPVL